jgi:hypothetical protein
MKFISALLFFLSANVFADVVEPLPKNDRLGQVARAVGTQLRDGNISTGTTAYWAGKLKRGGKFADEREFAKFVRGAFAEAFKDDRGEALPDDAKIQVTAGRFSDAKARAMRDAIMASNDYNPDNKEIRDSQERYVWAVLRKLPATEETWYGHARTKLQDSNSRAWRTVDYFLLVNEDRKTVQLFTIEGSM